MVDRIEPDLIHHSREGLTANLKNEFGSNLILLRVTNQVKELQTVIRDRNTSRSDFIFYSDRLIRLVVEEGLNQLPYNSLTITTPTGCQYEGLRYEEGNCGVSIMRSGEAMEQGLRDCCRSMRIGKILIMSDEETREAKVFYSKLPPDINKRKVLLMYPILCTGNSVMKALDILQQHSVTAENIIVLTLFATPQGIRSVLLKYPQVKILTSEVHNVVPLHFGQRYFGTD